MQFAKNQLSENSKELGKTILIAACRILKYEIHDFLYIYDSKFTQKEDSSSESSKENSQFILASLSKICERMCLDVEALKSSVRNPFYSQRIESQDKF